MECEGGGLVVFTKISEKLQKAVFPLIFLSMHLCVVINSYNITALSSVSVHISPSTTCSFIITGPRSESDVSWSRCWVLQIATIIIITHLTCK